MDKIVNLTPHGITVMNEEGTFVFPPSGKVARVETITTLVGYQGSIPVYKTTFGEVVNLPEKTDGVKLLVSLATAQAVANIDPSRDDLLVTNDAIRDESGRVIGCRSFGIV